MAEQTVHVDEQTQWRLDALKRIPGMDTPVMRVMCVSSPEVVDAMIEAAGIAMVAITATEIKPLIASALDAVASVSVVLENVQYDAEDGREIGTAQYNSLSASLKELDGTGRKLLSHIGGTGTKPKATGGTGAKTSSADKLAAIKEAGDVGAAIALAGKNGYNNLSRACLKKADVDSLADAYSKTGTKDLRSLAAALGVDVASIYSEAAAKVEEATGLKLPARVASDAATAA